MPPLGRSFTGAWIETLGSKLFKFELIVAPSRERGLKPFWVIWITIILSVAPSRERGLKRYAKISREVCSCRSFTGAWIETIMEVRKLLGITVAPSRERGLKPLSIYLSDFFT